MGESGRVVAGLLHIAGPSRRLREHRVSPLVAKRRLLALGRQPSSATAPASAATSRSTERAQPESSGASSRVRVEQASEVPLSPEEALAAFRVPDDLRIDLVLSEPIVRQPVSLSFDERGRLWVVQYLQYPFPAGLKMLSKDSVWRAVYDKVPQAPPHHVGGRDKITIHEDTDGDGVFDRHKTFVDGLNIATSGAPWARGRLGSESALSALLSRPQQRRRARWRSRGPPARLRAGRHALGCRRACAGGQTGGFTRPRVQL